MGGKVNAWLIALIIYLFFALITFFPTFKAILKKVKLHPGGKSFDASLHFSDEAKKLLDQHYSRIYGTLIFWKNQAEKYRNFHYYCLCWTIPSSIIIPILTQYISDDIYAKALLTVISSHTAILLAFHRGFKVDKNFNAFRSGESEFYDVYRRMLDRPYTFGLSEGEQLNSYFETVEIIRKNVRKAETDNLPTVEDGKTPHINK